MCAIFMDFVKAFDRVWHCGLLFKLASHGVSLDCLPWFQEYFSHRTLSVRVGNAQSAPHVAHAGVPQGSHLGPVLFLLFINDLPRNVCIATELYADEALLQHELELSISTEQSSDPQRIQQAVTAAEELAVSWHGRFCHSKNKSFACIPA